MPVGFGRGEASDTHVITPPKKKYKILAMVRVEMLIHLKKISFSIKIKILNNHKNLELNI
jgi:hypothetical protein